MLDMYTNVCCINNNKLTLLKASRGLKGREERGRDTDLWTHVFDLKPNLGGGSL